MNYIYEKLSKGSIALFAIASVAATANGGVPLNNLQGTGGIAFNPLAYTAGSPWDGGDSNALNKVVSKPQVGAWYVNLNDAGVNWWAGSAALTFAMSSASATKRQREEPWRRVWRGVLDPVPVLNQT